MNRIWLIELENVVLPPNYVRESIHMTSIYTFLNSKQEDGIYSKPEPHPWFQIAGYMLCHQLVSGLGSLSKNDPIHETCTQIWWHPNGILYTKYGLRILTAEIICSLSVVSQREFGKRPWIFVWTLTQQLNGKMWWIRILTNGKRVIYKLLLVSSHGGAAAYHAYLDLKKQNYLWWTSQVYTKNACSC